jgi:two-component SAPR family response regulator
MVESPAPSLTGLRCIVVEDEVLIGLFLAELLGELGCHVIANVTRVGKALELLEAERPDFMLLDVNVGGEMSYSLADALIERGIRFLFVSGYSSPSILGKYKDYPRLEKPITFQELSDALLKLMSF